MKTTNKFRLNEAIYKAITKKWYSGDKTQGYSVTELLKPTREIILSRRHDDVIEEDVSEKIYSLLGSAIHNVLERANNSDAENYLIGKINNVLNATRDGEITTVDEFHEKLTSGFLDKVNYEKLFNAVTLDRYMCEKRFKYTTSLGRVISGQIDLYDKLTKEISDYKVTSVYTWLYRNRPGSKILDYTKQLNMLRLFMMQAGHQVDSLSINMIFRDYSETEAERDHNYPNPIETIKLEIYPSEVVAAMIDEKVNELISYENVADDALPLCTPEERWQDKDLWAVMKKGNKKATKILWSYKAAQEFIDDTCRSLERKGKNFNTECKQYSIEKRPGKPKKCLRYCKCRKQCSFFKQLQET